MADRPTLTPADEAFAAFCEQGAFAIVAMARMAAMVSGTTHRNDQACSLSPRPSPRARLHTGYMPKAQRSAVRAGMYRAGVPAPRRATAADRARSEAAKWGLVR